MCHRNGDTVLPRGRYATPNQDGTREIAALSYVCGVRTVERKRPAALSATGLLAIRGGRPQRAPSGRATGEPAGERRGVRYIGA